MGYRLLPAAQADLERIGDYIAERDPGAAVRLLDRIHSRLRKLAALPASGTPREDIRPNTRMVVIGRYIVLYRPTAPRGIEVVRILHGRQSLSLDEMRRADPIEEDLLGFARESARLQAALPPFSEEDLYGDDGLPD